MSTSQHPFWLSMQIGLGQKSSRKKEWNAPRPRPRHTYLDPHSIPQIKPHADICMICRYLQKCELLLRIAIAAVTSKARHTVWWDTCHLLHIKIRYGALNVLAEQFAIIAPCGKYPMTTVHARQREQFRGHGPQWENKSCAT